MNIRCRVAKTHRMPYLVDHFPQRATNYRALLRKITYKDKASHESSASYMHEGH